MILREATQDDVPAILKIRRMAIENELRSPLTQAMLTKALQKNCKAFVAEHTGEVIAFVLANKPEKEVWGLFVLEPFQGKGIGKALLDLAVDWLWQQRYGWLRAKAKKLKVSTQQGSRAEGFYQHCGWQLSSKLGDQEVEYTLNRF